MIKNISITHVDSNGDTLMAEHTADDGGRNVLSLGSVYFTPSEWRAFKERVDGLFEPRDFPRTSPYDDEPSY